MFHVCFDVFGVFYTCIVLGLISLCHAQSQLMGPLHPVVARADDDITLLCYTEPAMDASDMTVEWSRPDLDLGKRLVYVWPERPELQNPPYKGRTSLFIDEMKYGNISLKISRVKLSDEGKYRCFVPDLRKDFTVQLIVGVASSPVISLIGLDEAISGVVLQCESAGWYPEPELLWLDGEGNLLSAGPTETLGGPDDFYTVSSRVTVEKRHSNNITCRVQQRNTNQSRETHIHVPDDFFSIIRPPSNPTSDPNIIISLVIGAVVVLLILTVVFVWKKRQAKCKKKKSDEENRAEVVLKLESEALMTGREEEEDDMDNRGEKNFKVERETHQDDHETETEQRRDTNSPQERRIYPSTVIDKESLIRMEHKTQDMTGREEDNDADSREEQRHEDERETQQDHFVLEIEQIKDINSLQEKRINSSTVIDKESLITIEEETQDMTGGEEEDDVYNSGEKKTQKKMLMKKKKNKKKQSKAVDTDSPGIKTSTATEKDPQFEKKKDTHEEQSMRRRHEITYNVDTRGEDRNTFHLSTDQEPLRGKDTQQDQFVLETEQMNDINSPQEKRINQCTVIDKESLITIEQQKGMKAEGAEGEREKKMETGKNYLRLQFLSLTEKLKEPIVFGKESKSFNFSFHLSSDQEPWREKETQQELLVEKRQMERNVDMKKSDTEKTRAEENSGEVNNLYSVFMAQKETQREKLEAEQQRENQRRLQSETRRERERDEIELKIRKDNKTQHYTDEKTVKTRRILKARRHQNPRKVKGCVENQNDDHMEVDDFAHQNAATPQLYETIRWTKDQEKLPVQSEPQEYLKENNEVLEDQMEVD